ncbi:MAG: ABC transporter permease subunit [Myxococcota bacterium]|nr:ABC transporter permease subunit [Myxococcota bacterium]
MKRWWIRPLIRLISALLLPLAVPAVITAFIWALPGDPASIVCPPEICGGTEELARAWHLDQGAWAFYKHWLAGALQGDFGNSWRMQTGFPVADLLWESVPRTAALVGLAFIPLLLGAVGAATRAIPKWVDNALSAVGLVPAVVLALLAAAWVTLEYGAMAYDPEAMRVKLLLGALVLGLADAALSGAVIGVRGITESERTQRYVQMAILRGEGELSNALPNILPALAGQMRARLLALLSGSVIVEVIVRIDGMGDLIWQGTLSQDFAVVLAAAFGFALLSAGMLLLQALIEIGVALHVRRSPQVAA